MNPLVPEPEVAAALPDPRRRRFAMAAIISTAAIFGLTYGLSAPLIAVSLAARGARARTKTSASMPPAATNKSAVPARRNPVVR